MSSLNPQHAQRSIWSASQLVTFHQQQAENKTNSIDIKSTRICFSDDQPYSSNDQSEKQYGNLNNGVVNEPIEYLFLERERNRY